MARKICDFNHISPELNREQIDELIGYYKTTHQKWFLYKKAHRHYKLIKYAARLTSGTIAPFRFRFDYYISWCFIINRNFT